MLTTTSVTRIKKARGSRSHGPREHTRCPIPGGPQIFVNGKLLSGIFVGLVIILLTGCAGQQDLAELGPSLYKENCQSCHGDAATGEGAIPNAPPHGRIGHTWHHADGHLSAIILGESNFPGRTMPSFAGILNEDEVEVILAYLKTGWTDKQRATQAEESEKWKQYRENIP